MFSEVPLPLNAPVYVTHDEASAYATLGRQNASLPKRSFIGQRTKHRKARSVSIRGDTLSPMLDTRQF